MKAFLVIAMFALGATCCFSQSSGCTVATLRGSYGFTTYGSGSYKDRGGINHNGYIRSIGVFSYGGDGTVVVKGKTFGADNQIKAISSTGSYIISKGCAGNIKLKRDDNGSESTLTFVVVSGGSEIETVTDTANGEPPFLQRKQ
jgi:hypothetical protein